MSIHLETTGYESVDYVAKWAVVSISDGGVYATFYNESHARVFIQAAEGDKVLGLRRVYLEKS